MVGYYTLAAGSARREETPARVAKGLVAHPVPIILLARLAVDGSEKGKGLGKGLLEDCALAGRPGGGHRRLSCRHGARQGRRGQRVLSTVRLRTIAGRSVPALLADEGHQGELGYWCRVNVGRRRMRCIASGDCHFVNGKFAVERRTKPARRLASRPVEIGRGRSHFRKHGDSTQSIREIRITGQVASRLCRLGNADAWHVPHQ